MKQLQLPIDEDYLTNSIEFFVTSCNEEAYKFLITQYDPVNIPFNRIVLIGPKSSGKSRLAKMWLANNQGMYLNCRLNSLDVRIETRSTAIVIDNFELADEIELLHIINKCVDNCIIVLLVASNDIVCKLPDLHSRINSSYKLKISQPDDDMVLLMIQEMCFVNKIKVHVGTIEYIKNNVHFNSFTNLLSFKLQLQRLCEDNRMILDINTLKNAYDNWYRM